MKTARLYVFVECAKCLQSLFQGNKTNVSFREIARLIAIILNLNIDFLFSTQAEVRISLRAFLARQRNAIQMEFGLKVAHFCVLTGAYVEGTYNTISLRWFLGQNFLLVDLWGYF